MHTQWVGIQEIRLDEKFEMFAVVYKSRTLYILQRSVIKSNRKIRSFQTIHFITEVLTILGYDVFACIMKLKVYADREL